MATQTNGNVRVYSSIVWDDIPGILNNGNLVGVNDPSWDVYVGGTRRLAFSPTQNQEVQIGYHVTHRWKPGTDMFPHVHWVPSDSTAGSVVLSFGWTITKSGVVSPAEIISTLTIASNGIGLAEQVNEFAAIPASAISVGVTIVARFWRVANDAADTYGAKIFVPNVDIHFQSDREGTSTKIPPYDA